MRRRKTPWEKATVASAQMTAEEDQDGEVEPLREAKREWEHPWAGIVPRTRSPSTGSGAQ